MVAIWFGVLFNWNLIILDDRWLEILSQCLKIIKKVAFKIVSEASYVYILNGQMTKRRQIDAKKSPKCRQIDAKKSPISRQIVAKKSPKSRQKVAKKLPKGRQKSRQNGPFFGIFNEHFCPLKM